QQLWSRLSSGNPIPGGSGDVPVAANAEAVLVEHRQVRRRQFADLAQDGGGRGNVLAGEVLDQGFRIQLPWDAAMGEERLELRAEDHARPADEIIERLLAQP